MPKKTTAHNQAPSMRSRVSVPAFLGIVIALAVLLAKLPLIFRTLGEADQGRLIMDAVIYHSVGPETLRRYGLFTSPLWALCFSGLAGVFTADRLVWVSNIGGWICGGVSVTLAFALLRELGASRGWASSGAVASALIPSTFYFSLYGFPSQYAVPLLLGSAVAFSRALGARTWRAGLPWLFVSGIVYCLLALTKIDFAVSGTFLIGVAVIRGKIKDSRNLALAAYAAVAVAAVYLVTRAAIHDENLPQFFRRWSGIYPWDTDFALDDSWTTALYSCGLGTIVLWAAAALAGFLNRRERYAVIRIAIAWVVGVLPLWIFWLAHPPMSTRHALPGALITVLLAACLASRAFRGIKYAPLVWLVALITANWPLGTPNLDFNYRPSGNLIATLSTSAKARAVRNEIARRIVAQREPIKVILGPRQRNVLGGVDFVPSVEIAMASQSRHIQPVGSTGWDLRFTSADGHDTLLLPYMAPAQAAISLRSEAAHFYSPWKVDITPLTSQGTDVTSFDPDAMFRKRR
jgi:hypothetical protein